MDTEDNVNEIEKFQKVWKEIFSGENGKFAIKMLKSMYIDSSALGQSSEHTHYLLGQKELIQHLIANATSEE